MPSNSSTPTFTIVSTESFNPKFRAIHPKAQEQYLEELLDEKMTAKMITKESAPLAFVVPEGCDSVEFTYGAIEVNPEHGKDHDLEQVVTLGEATVSAEAATDSGALGPLVAGSAVVVTVPWRAASWVNLGPSHLKVKVNARFYSAMPSQ